MSPRVIGLIGVGLVGTALARRWISQGAHVHGFDIDPLRLETLQTLGGQPASTAAEVIDTAETIVLSLPTSEVALHLLESLPGRLAGKIIVDTTTGEPSEMAALGEEFARRGAQYVDATIAGSSNQVESGAVIVMVGGSAETVRTCDALFRSFSRQTFHVGGWGAGARMKLVVNLVLGLHRAVLAEALNFSKRLGIDPAQTLEVLLASPAFSRVMETKADKMLRQDFTPQARLAQHLKDVRLILATGAENKALLPFSTLHAELLEQLDQAGFGGLDNSAIIKAFQ